MNGNDEYLENIERQWGNFEELQERSDEIRKDDSEPIDIADEEE